MSDGNIKRLFRKLREKLGRKTGNQVIELVLDELSGMRLVFPTAREVGRWDRDAQIIELFDGGNHQELADRFGIRPRQIRRILHREVARRKEEDYL